MSSTGPVRHSIRALVVRCSTLSRSCRICSLGWTHITRRLTLTFTVRSLIDRIGQGATSLPVLASSRLRPVDHTRSTRPQTRRANPLRTVPPTRQSTFCSPSNASASLAVLGRSALCGDAPPPSRHVCLGAHRQAPSARARSGPCMLHCQRRFSARRHSRREKPGAVGCECKAVGVAYSATTMIVIEIHVHVLASIPQVSESTGPTRKGRPAIAGCRVRSALMQPHVPPFRCAPERGLPLWSVAEAERRPDAAAKCPLPRRCTTIRGAVRMPP